MHIRRTAPAPRRCTRPASLAAVGLLAFLLVALRAAPAAADGADDRDKAAAFFKQGQAYFQRGDYDRAITEYQSAFELSKEPSLVFNIALCHNRANRPEPALEGYRKYLELAPNGDVADEARDEIARLTPIVDKLQADRAAQRTAEEARKREAAEREARNRPRPPASRVPRYIFIAGGAIALVGVTAHVLAWRTRGDMESAPDADSYFDDRDTFRGQRTVAIGAYAVGAATMATALVLGVTVFRRPEAPHVSAAPTQGGALVTVGWSR
jgi:tetratricopeptide (TPR) repeat protein